jgi:hypothetical protein
LATPRLVTRCARAKTPSSDVTKLDPLFQLNPHKAIAFTRTICDAKGVYSLHAAEYLGPSLRILSKRDLMSAVWKSTCSKCGERHTFYFRDADVLPQNKSFEYECPKTAGTVLYVAADCEWAQLEAVKPPDAVHLRIPATQEDKPS